MNIVLDIGNVLVDFKPYLSRPVIISIVLIISLLHWRTLQIIRQNRFHDITDSDTMRE